MEDLKKPSNQTIREGWTLRDEFANSAMQGLLSNSTFNAKLPSQNEGLAILVYQIADAMLKQREL